MLATQEAEELECVIDLLDTGDQIRELKDGFGGSMKKRKVWFEPSGVPGLGLCAIILKKEFIGYKILYRDIDRCRILHFVSNKELSCERY